MKIDDLKQSERVEDRRGEDSGSGFGGESFGGGGGGGLGLLLQLLFSSGKGKWIFIAIILFGLFSSGSGLGDLMMGMGANSSPRSYQESKSNTSTVSDEDAVFVSKVFASTEEFWTQQFQKEGRTYNPPTLVLYDGHTQTRGCGVGSASAGPFYCPGDNKVYIDLSFYKELGTRYKAKGDFAMAYVIAHEVGHHVQNELGIMTQYNSARRGKSEAAANALNVRLELQADYYAGAWAKYVDGKGLLEMGDIEEAMNAAHAVGDDTLQEEAYGRTVPDSFTHGTSAQRKQWFDRGYQYGDIEHGDTFSANIE